MDFSLGGNPLEGYISHVPIAPVTSDSIRSLQDLEAVDLYFHSKKTSFSSSIEVTLFSLSSCGTGSPSVKADACSCPPAWIYPTAGSTERMPFRKEDSILNGIRTCCLLASNRWSGPGLPECTSKRTRKGQTSLKNMRGRWKIIRKGWKPIGRSRLR